MDYVAVVMDAINYIEDNLDQNITHSDLAEEFYISPFHFFRIFQVVTSHTVKDYVDHRRMSIALDLLENTNLKVIDVALECGINTPEAFSRKFKSAYGVTPREFRKKPSDIERFDKLDIPGREFYNKNNSMLMKHEVLNLPETVIYGKRFKFDFVEKEKYRIRKFAEDFRKRCSLENKNSTEYCITLSHGKNVKDIDYFIGADGIAQRELEEFVLKETKYISLKYNGDYSYRDKAAVKACINDMYRVIVQMNYTINKDHAKLMEVYKGDYYDNFDFEMRIPII